MSLLTRLVLAIPSIQRLYFDRNRLVGDFRAVTRENELLRSELRECRAEQLDKLCATFDASGHRSEEETRGDCQSNLVSFMQALGAVRGQPTDPPSPLLLIFIHVPKTGGNTLNNLLKQNVAVFHEAAAGSSFLAGLSRDKVQAVLAAGRSALAGHSRLSDPLFGKLPRRSASVTVVREPLKRMISNFNFTLRHPVAPWHEEVRTGKMGIVELTEGFTRTIGHQFEYFLRPEDAGGEHAVEQAIENLEKRVTFFGLTEHFDDFVVAAGILLGIRNIVYGKPANVTRDMPVLAEGDRKLLIQPMLKERKALESLLQADIEFYRRAKALYQERIKELDTVLGGGVLLGLIEAFRTVNCSYVDILEKWDRLLLN